MFMLLDAFAELIAQAEGTKRSGNSGDRNIIGVVIPQRKAKNRGNDAWEGTETEGCIEGCGIDRIAAFLDNLSRRSGHDQWGGNDEKC
jgi:hypothetical protein